MYDIRRKQNMRDIRRFDTGQLFGIKAIDHSVRTGVKVATLGRYDRTRNGFAVNMISSEGVAGSNQALRFENRADAERWIAQNHAAFGYDADEMQVMKTVGVNWFWKVPVAGFEIAGWVNKRKFDHYSDSQMDKFIEEMPEYFAYHEWPNENEMQSLEGNYRGFSF